MGHSNPITKNDSNKQRCFLLSSTNVRLHPYPNWGDPKGGSLPARPVAATL